MSAMPYTVGEVSQRTGVTIRTLHHYDALGLLVPERTAADVRVYDDEDLERLAGILTWRALGVPLDRIGDLLDGGDEVTELSERRRAVRAHLARLERLLVDLDERLKGHDMDPDTIKAVFDGFDPDSHAAEAEERWGDSDAWTDAQRRTGSYGVEQWQTIKAEGDGIGDRFGLLVDAGVDPASTEAMDLAEEHRAHISRWFYDCTPEIHAGLAEMYATDARFTEYWEAFGEGVTAFVSAAIAANAARMG